MTLGSLFDGIGGWLLAAKHAGIEPLWSSEIAAFPCAVTKHHFPDVVQLGDITKLDGAKLWPVDIICAGSPCQDLSVAGKQEGLQGERSGLFRDAIRLVRDMRRASGGRYPRFFVWENVPGAFSSNKGLDFRAVLEEIGQTEIPMPQGGKWANAGLAELPTCDIAWRVLDAQYWGVPQRRKRIFLVADFRGRSAGEILFECEGVRGHIAEGGEVREGTAAGTESCAHGASVVRMRAGKPGGGKGALVSRERSLTLAANTNDQVLFVPDKARSLTVKASGSFCIDGRGSDIVAAGFKVGNSEAAHSIGYAVETSPTLSAMDSGNKPAVVAYSFDSLASNSMKSSNPHSGCRKVEVAKTLDTTNPDPSKNQGGIAVYDMTHADEVMRKVPDGRSPTLNARMGTGGNQVPVVHSYSIAGNTIDRQIHNGGNGKGVLEEKSYTLNTIDRHAVCIGNGQADQAKMSDKVGALNCMHDQQAVMVQQTVGSLCADDHKGINNQYVDQGKCVIQKSVRRLTPTECERLQGLEDGYTLIDDKTCSDTARYKALGNGMAQPCADYVIRRIVEVTA